jgi:DNA-binding response OmpR family regulator
MGRGTVLVVDDSPLTVEAVRRGLEATGFTVRSACDLASIPRPLDVDLVLMDVEMAEAFGDDLALVLRTDEAGPPIYLLSALEEEELADRAVAAGVDGFIPKRAGVGEVVHRVESILGGVPPGAGRGPRAGLLPMFVETARRRARHARAALELAGRDELRRAAYELHALVGESAVLGFVELAELARQGRHAAVRCEQALTAAHRAACEDLVTAVEEQVERLAVAAIARGDLSARTEASPQVLGRRVLLLDDSDVFRAVLRAILEDTGYTVAEAGTLAEGRALLGALPPCDLVILDVELADGAGPELIPEVRAAMPGAGVVVLSGGEARTLPTGADLALLKTLDPTTVLVKLERLLEDEAEVPAGQ